MKRSAVISVLVGLMLFCSLAGRAMTFDPAWKPEGTIHRRVDARSGFVHPGIGFTGDDLANLARRVRTGVEPWRGYFDRLVERDKRFSKTPQIRTRREQVTAIDSPDVDNRCEDDSKTAICQAVLYVITGEEVYRANALDIVRWFPAHVTSAKPHWDSQFRWPSAERWYLMACEILRYTGPQEGPLAWTEADTEAVDRFVSYGKDLWRGRNQWINQLQFALGGHLARAIWQDDKAYYEEMVEIFTVNKDGPVGSWNGSVAQTCRLVTTNDLTGAEVTPHVQYSEMGRDIGHPFCAHTFTENLVILWSQGTKVDPVTGTVSTKEDAVDPLFFRKHALLQGFNEICKYNLGFDIDWTPICIEKKKNQYWERPANGGGGRGRIETVFDVPYSIYRWRLGANLKASEKTRYFDYAVRLRGPDLFRAFFWTDGAAEGKWTDEGFDPGRDKMNRFAEFILPRDKKVTVKKDAETNGKYLAVHESRFILPMFLSARNPLPAPGTYTIRYRSAEPLGIGIVNPEDYATEFADGTNATKRIHVEKVLLPATEGAWREESFTLENPPKRKLIKLDFRTNAPNFDIAWMKVP